MKFAASLLELRRQASLTQDEAARLLNVPLKTYQSWEQGVRMPTPYVTGLILTKFSQLTVGTKDR